MLQAILQGRSDACRNTIPTSRRNKKLGQHFLHNIHYVQKILDACPTATNTPVLEIGPGDGALTKHLSKRYRELYVLEKDPYWAGVHSCDTDIAGVVCCDALTFNWKKVSTWPIISNLPYNIASPLLWDIVAQCCTTCVFMVQREVGERILASPKTSQYGALSVWIQSFAHVEKICIVPPQAFSPPPKVDSMVIRVLPHTHKKRADVPEQLSNFLHHAFRNRRKQLQSSLRNMYPNILEALSYHHIPHTARVEELAPKTIHDLINTLVTRK